MTLHQIPDYEDTGSRQRSADHLRYVDAMDVEMRRLVVQLGRICLAPSTVNHLVILQFIAVLKQSS